MDTATISWTTNSTSFATNFTHTRVRVLNGATGEVAAQEFVSLPGATVTFANLTPGTYSADIGLSNATGSVVDSAGIIGTGSFAITQQFTLPRPTVATVVVS